MLTSKPRAHASWVSPLPAEPQGSTEADQQSFAGRWHQNQLSGYLCVLGFYGGLRYTRRLGAPSQRELWDCVPPCTQDRQLSVTVPCRLLGLDSLRFPHPLPCLFLQTLCHIGCECKGGLVTSWSVRKCGKEHVTKHGLCKTHFCKWDKNPVWYHFLRITLATVG